jgi:phosphopantothenoylcysteine decarboxylase / phosphopantothenate---cysteine ligase
MKILVGISGSIGILGIPAYLASLQAEKEVEELRILMTPTATRFLNPQALEALLRRSVYVDPWTDGRPMISPPELVRDIDVYLIAPASATTLSRCATGSGETLLAHCYLCHTGPSAFAPAMSAEMWEHPAVLRNLNQLKDDGAHILPAGMGYSAATGKIQRTSLCPYNEMWSILKSLSQRRYEEERQ